MYFEKTCIHSAPSHTWILCCVLLHSKDGVGIRPGDVSNGKRPNSQLSPRGWLWLQLHPRLFIVQGYHSTPFLPSPPASWVPVQTSLKVSHDVCVTWRNTLDALTSPIFPITSTARIPRGNQQSSKKGISHPFWLICGSWLSVFIATACLNFILFKTMQGRKHEGVLLTTNVCQY